MDASISRADRPGRRYAVNQAQGGAVSDGGATLVGRERGPDVIWAAPGSLVNHVETTVRGLNDDARPSDRAWWRITNAAKQRTAILDIYDQIGPWGTTAKDLVKQLRALDVDEIQMHVNSPGGDYFDGIAILNSLRDHPARLVATVDGLAASAASFIVMAADELVMARNSEMMIHEAQGFAMGDSNTMRDLAGRLDHISNNIASVYAERAGGDPEDWRAAMHAETWYSAQEAVDAGLADRVAEPPPSVPSDAPKNRFDYSIFNYAGRAAAPTPTFPAAKAGTHDPQPKEGGAVADLAKLREVLGLDPDSSDDEVRAAVSAQLPGPAPTAGAATAPPAPAEAKADETVLPAPDTNATLVVATSVWEDQQRTIKDLSEFVAQTKRGERDAVLAQAARDGKFRPSQTPDFVKLWDKDPEGTRNLVDRMTPNSALAVAALGYATDLEDDSLDAEFAGLFPPDGKGR
jgi:ATP-dependent protease ClpP protease subunit